MIWLYITFCIAAIVAGYLFYRNFYNPVCIYTFVWLVSVAIHESDLIVYYDFKWFTWIVIFVSHLIFILGNIIAKLFYEENKSSYLDVNEILQKKYLFRGILVCLCISGFAIVANIKMMIALYGTNLFENMMVIYQDRLENALRTEAIPYLSSFLFVALPLLGVYMKKNGFNVMVVIGLVLACANSLTSGGRAGIIFSLLLFFTGYKCTEGNPLLKTRQIFSSGKKKILLTLCIVSLASMIVAVSQQRSAGIELDYATDNYTSLFGENVPLYKGLVYLASPVAVLNEYLETCDFDFGKNTFVTFFNILNKFGLCDKVAPYQSYYNTPSSCNVGTWIRELIEDFTMPVALLIVAFFGFLSSSFYYRAQGHTNIMYKVLWSVFSLVIALSFFDWKFRTSNLWIAVFVGCLIGFYIDKYSRVSREK